MHMGRMPMHVILTHGSMQCRLHMHMQPTPHMHALSIIRKSVIIMSAWAHWHPHVTNMPMFIIEMMWYMSQCMEVVSERYLDWHASAVEALRKQDSVAAEAVECTCELELPHTHIQGQNTC